MTVWENLELAVVTRLSTIAGVQARAVEESESQLNRAFVTPRATVIIMQSEFGGAGDIPKNEAMSQLSVFERIEIHVIVESKLLRGPLGAYQFLENIKKKLVGWRPVLGTAILSPQRLHPIECRYLENTDGVSKWDVIFKCFVPVIQDEADDHGVEYPILQSVTVHQDIGALADFENYVLEFTDNSGTVARVNQ
jgi:hypothetical protein